MDLSNEIAERIQLVEQRILQACDKAGRRREEVTLVAVSKLQPLEKIKAAYSAGQRIFGENYVQEALKKKAALHDLNELSFHLIGPLQKNKVNKSVGLFEVIQTVDSLVLAELIARQAEKLTITQAVFIQVNISAEENKSGVMPEQVVALVNAITQLKAIKVMGLMCIGTWEVAPEVDLRSARISEFKVMQSLARELELSHGERCLLSMGMSDDFELAVEYGANIIRVGTAIFGERPAKG